MNLFSKFKAATLTLVLCFSSSAKAIDVSAYYLGACKRIVGVPLKVDTDQIQVLSLEGKVATIPRYEITYVATYPIDVVPFRKIENTSEVPPIRILTRQHGSLVELVRGWPVEFSDEMIAFLTTKGEGVVVDKMAIWHIDELTSSDNELAFISKAAHHEVDFIHPQAFGNCQQSGIPNAQKIVPQQLLSEPLTIKREFDRLQKGEELVQAYEVRQSFYPYPHLYGNDAVLGLWTSVGSRYGASAFRSNNFTPLLRTEKNTGPFSYQHQILTGSGPNPESVHEEPQTQASYRFKADYFQLSAMSDLSFILIGGQKYRWSFGDLDEIDFRMNDVARLGFGFDYGAFSLYTIPVDVLNTGSRFKNQFAEDSVNLPRFGVAVKKPSWSVDINSGSGNGSKVAMTFLRANATFELNDLTSLSASYIQRASDYSSDPKRTFNLKSTSSTAAVWMNHLYHKRIVLSGYVSYEIFSADGSFVSVAPDSVKRNFIKGGALVGLSF